MNRSQAFLLIAVLGLGTFYFWSKLHKLEVQEREYQAKRYFPEKTEADIEAIALSCTDPVFDYVLRRAGDRWYLDGRLANQEKSPQLVMSLIELATEREMVASPNPEDIKQFGLDKPTYTITLTGNGGKDLGTVLLGNRAPGGNHFYGRWKKGGAVSTVPAYTLSPLEEEPEELREASPFPLEVPAVDRFAFLTEKGSGRLQRPEGAEEGFRLIEPSEQDADESKVNELMYLLRDLKVARFLAKEEKTDLGAPLATYRAHEVESKVDLVTEFCQPVAVTPKLRYGRRYLTDPSGKGPLKGTEERFVIELLADSKVLQATPAAFQDRRIMKLDVDKVSKVTVLRDGVKVVVERLPQGGWKFLEPPQRVEEPDPGQRVDKLLWAIRDLRVAGDKAKIDPSGKGEWRAELVMKDGASHAFRFGLDRSGKPLVGFEEKNFLQQEDLVPALEDAARGLLSEQPTATPTPQPSN